MPCPWDPRHDVKASGLEHHRLVCPSRLAVTEPRPFCIPNVNVPGGGHSSQSDAAKATKRLRLHDLPEDEGRAFLAWLSQQSKRLDAQSWWRKGTETSSLALDNGSDAIGLQRLDNIPVGGDTKHRSQQLALCRLVMQKSNDVQDVEKSMTVVEVGAGKGGVACVLKCLNPHWRIAVVERSTLRDPKEKEINRRIRWGTFCSTTSSADHPPHEGADSAAPVTAVPLMERISMDAKDFDSVGYWLSTAPSPSPAAGAVVGKHLCGNCSDFAVAMHLHMLRYASDNRAQGNAKRPREADETIHHDSDDASCTASSHDHGTATASLVLATCCHHLCNYEQYVGRSVVLTTTLGDATSTTNTEDVTLFPTQRHFDVCTSICSWALIGDGASAEPHAKQKCDDGTKAMEASMWVRNLSSADKIHFGRLAKTLIDGGRIGAIARQNAHADLRYVPYISSTVSGECWAIVSM